MKNLLTDLASGGFFNDFRTQITYSLLGSSDKKKKAPKKLGKQGLWLGASPLNSTRWEIEGLLGTKL